MAYPSENLRLWHLPVLADVAVGALLNERDDIQFWMDPEQMGEAFLRFQIFLDRQLFAYRQRADLHTMLGLEHREQTGFMRQPRDKDGVVRGCAPAQRTRHKNMNVARAVKFHRAFHLGFEVAQRSEEHTSELQSLR